MSKALAFGVIDISPSGDEGTTNPSVGPDPVVDIILNRISPSESGWISLSASPGAGAGLEFSLTPVNKKEEAETWGISSVSVTKAGLGYKDGSKIAVSLSSRVVEVNPADIYITVDKSEPVFSTKVESADGIGGEVSLSFSKTGAVWELSGVTISAAGSGYHAGEKILATGSLNTYDVYGKSAGDVYGLEVSKVSGDGGISAVSLAGFTGTYYSSTGAIQSATVDDMGEYYATDSVKRVVLVYGGSFVPIKICEYTYDCGELSIVYSAEASGGSLAITGPYGLCQSPNKLSLFATPAPPDTKLSLETTLSPIPCVGGGVITGLNSSQYNVTGDIQSDSYYFSKGEIQSVTARKAGAYYSIGRAKPYDGTITLACPSGEGAEFSISLSPSSTQEGEETWGIYAIKVTKAGTGCKNGDSLTISHQPTVTVVEPASLKVVANTNGEVQSVSIFSFGEYYSIGRVSPKASEFTVTSPSGSGAEFGISLAQAGYTPEYEFWGISSVSVTKAGTQCDDKTLLDVSHSSAVTKIQGAELVVSAVDRSEPTFTTSIESDEGSGGKISLSFYESSGGLWSFSEASITAGGSGYLVGDKVKSSAVGRTFNSQGVLAGDRYGITVSKIRPPGTATIESQDCETGFEDARWVPLCPGGSEECGLIGTNFTDDIYCNGFRVQPITIPSTSVARPGIEPWLLRGVPWSLDSQPYDGPPGEEWRWVGWSSCFESVPGVKTFGFYQHYIPSVAGATIALQLAIAKTCYEMTAVAQLSTLVFSPSDDFTGAQVYISWQSRIIASESGSKWPSLADLGPWTCTSAGAYWNPPNNIGNTLTSVSNYLTPSAEEQAILNESIENGWIDFDCMMSLTQMPEITWTFKN